MSFLEEFALIFEPPETFWISGANREDIIETIAAKPAFPRAFVLEAFRSRKSRARKSFDPEKSISTAKEFGCDASSTNPIPRTRPTSAQVRRALHFGVDVIEFVTIAPEAFFDPDGLSPAV
jgi:hypothetical protein